MPYNTTAIPPRKDVTGQTQLPLSRVKKIIAQDQDIQICSNNAAFAITVATEMFIQHLAAKALDQAKAERKPRRNIQYKDIASAVHGHDNLEFLEDLVPKTVKFKDVKAAAAATRASLRGERSVDHAVEGAEDEEETRAPISNGTKKHKSSAGRSNVNGSLGTGNVVRNGRGANGAEQEPRRQSDTDDNNADPNDQLQMEMRQARGNDDDVEMAD